MGYTGTAFTDLESLCSRLRVSPSELHNLANNISKHVRAKTEFKLDGSPRHVLAPSERLKAIQRSIKHELLISFIYPAYIYGLSGDTLRAHALVHQNKEMLIKLDLRDFFPSINYKRVYSMWISEFGFTPTTARLLTKLTTYEYKLQQGFPTSSHLATIIAMPFTSQVYGYCSQRSLGFSQYVDDINLSGNSMDFREIFKLITDAARSNDFSIKRKKTKVYNLHTGKLITGVALVGNRTRAPRAVRQKAIDALKAFAADPVNDTLRNRVLGYGGFLGHLNKNDGKKYKEQFRRAEGVKERDL